MKKLYLVLLIIVILSSIFIKLILRIDVDKELNNNSNVVFEKRVSVHNRNKNYDRTFDVEIYSDNQITVVFEDDLYTDIEKNEIYSIINEYYHELEKKLYSFEEVITIYLVENLDYSFSENGTIYCPMSLFDNGDYELSILMEVYKLPKLWQAYGLKSYYNNVTLDNENIKTIFNEENFLSISSLLFTRFLKEFNSEEELESSIQVSSSFVKYIIDKYGFEYLYSEEILEIFKEWARDIGITNEYSDDYESLYKYVLFERNLECNLVAYHGETTYYINKMERNLERSSDIDEFLYKNILSRKLSLDIVSNLAMEYKLEYRKDSNLNIYLDDSIYKSRAIGDNIYLRKPSQHTHEYIHILLKDNPEDHWESEGIAEYLGVIACPNEYMYNSKIIHEYFLKNYASYHDLDPKSLEYNLMDYYFKHTEDFLKQEEFEMRLYYDANSYMFNYIERNGDKYYAKPLYEHFGLKESLRKEGDELSYFEAGSFIAFLVDEYSLGKVLQLSGNTDSFELIFEDSYSNLKSEWLNYIKR